MIDYKDLIKSYSYNPETGEFYRLVSTNWNNKPGLIKGTIVNGYRQLMVFNKRIYAHRLAWIFVYGEIFGEIDHINGKKDDNRICNLRDVSKSENMKNRKSSQTNNKSSKVPGVSYNKNWKKYIVSMVLDGKQKNYGFNSLEEAEKASIELRRNSYKTFTL